MAQVKITGKPTYIDALYFLLEDYQKNTKAFEKFVSLSPREKLSSIYAKYLVVAHGVNFLSPQEQQIIDENRKAGFPILPS